jgi:hypothetical protein
VPRIVLQEKAALTILVIVWAANDRLVSPHGSCVTDETQVEFGVNAAASHRTLSDCEDDSLDGVLAVSDHDAYVVAGLMSFGIVKVANYSRRRCASSSTG